MSSPNRLFRRKSTSEALQGVIQPALLGTFILGLLWLEKRRPLRGQAEDKLRHDLRNFTVAGLSALTIQITEKPVTDRLTKLVERNKIGLLPRLKLSPNAESILAVILLDYTLYLWHVLTHKVPSLWRFHEVHHEDLDLTATTAIRFHFAEMALSTLHRASQVLLIGTSAKALKLWQTLTLFEILFHHSNIKLPIRVERVLSRFIVTPRMHAIHHSTVEQETHSNWSSGLTIWDWLHGTLRLDVPQNQIQIGVPAYGSNEDVTLPSLLVKPFKKQKPSWSKQALPQIKRSKAEEHTVLAEPKSNFSNWVEVAPSHP